MSIVIGVLSLVGLPVLGVLLLLGVLSLIRDLPELDSQGDPSFQESAAVCNDGTPLCNDATVDTQQPRSQFAWQSRSHSRAPD
jgi:hypothetical protein